MVRLFDPTNDNLTRNIQSWEVGEMRSSRLVTVTPETVRVSLQNRLLSSRSHREILIDRSSPNDRRSQSANRSGQPFAQNRKGRIAIHGL